jgi:hypothetical protein
LLAWLQLCGSALLSAHATLAVFDIALLHICGRTGPAFLAQALALRLCALAVGLGTDMGRRFAFTRQQLQQHQQKLQRRGSGAAKC